MLATWNYMFWVLSNFAFLLRAHKTSSFKCNIVDGCRRNAKHQHQEGIIIFIQIKFYILSICTIRATVLCHSKPEISWRAKPRLWSEPDGGVRRSRRDATRPLKANENYCYSVWLRRGFFFAIFVRFNVEFFGRKPTEWYGACRQPAPREDKSFFEHFRLRRRQAVGEKK